MAATSQPPNDRANVWYWAALRWAVALAIFVVGLHFLDFRYGKTAALGLLLFATPLLGQAVKRPIVRAYSLWIGVFVLLQTIAAPVLLGHHYDLITLPPKLDDTIVFAPGALPGIVGAQHVTTDEKGFRDNPRIDYAHKTGVRIFAIGGSTTEEIDTDDDRTWTHLLQEQLHTALGRPVSVVNAGVSGLRARQHLATLEEIVQYHPDLVLFLVGVNDWVHDIRVHFGSKLVDERERVTFDRSPLGRLAQSFGTAVLHTGEAAPRVFHVGKAPPGFFYTGLALHRNSLVRPVKYHFHPADVSRQYLGYLEQISRVCKEEGITCLFISQPNAYQPDVEPALQQHFWETPPNEGYTLTFGSLMAVAKLYNRSLVAFATSHGHPVCDIADKLAPTLANFGDDVHYTLAGSQRVAALVEACAEPLVKRPLGPPPR